MKLEKLGQTGLEVTPIGFGVLTVGKTQLDYPVEKGAALLRYALEKGINFLDTAQYYETYPYIKAALKGTDFNPVIVSKSLTGTRQDMAVAVEEARREMDRDVIEVFLLHEVRGGGDWESRAGAWDYLNDAKAKGLVKAIGVSTHHVDVAVRCAGFPEVDVLFPLINHTGLGIRKGAGTGTKEEMATAIKQNGDAGKGVFGMKVLGGGILAAQYLEALDYAYALPGLSAVVLGFGHHHEIDRIIEYVEGTIDRSYVPDVTDKKIRIDVGDCEGCGACLERCPNRAIVMDGPVAVVDHALCLTCGYCAPVCPVRAIIMF